MDGMEIAILGANKIYSGISSQSLVCNSLTICNFFNCRDGIEAEGREKAQDQPLRKYND